MEINRVGLYEKALPDSLTWREKFAAAQKAGYDFLEISIDESPERLLRAKWPQAERRRLYGLILRYRMPVYTMCLSGTKCFSIGSEQKEVREAGIALVKDTIGLAVDLGVRVIQLAGSDVYYSASNAHTKRIFVDSMGECLRCAAKNAVTLSFETMDTGLMDSVDKTLEYIALFGSPWLQVYPDVGNLHAAGYDAARQLALAERHMAAVHIKDAKPGIARDVALGEGGVDFPAVFSAIRKMRYCGPLVLEMWSDQSAGFEPVIAAAIRFLKNGLEGSAGP